MEPFSTSVFKDLTWIFATTTKICTSGSSSWVHTQSLQRNHYDPLTRHCKTSSQKYRHMTAEYRWPAPAPSIFRASWFGRWVVRHSLADSDFHGHRPAVCINQHLLWGLMSGHFGTATLRLVHPTSPVLLTKNGPLGARIQRQSSIKQLRHHTHLEFENRLRTFRSQVL